MLHWQLYKALRTSPPKAHHGVLVEAVLIRPPKVRKETTAPPNFGKENNPAQPAFSVGSAGFFVAGSRLMGYMAAVLTVSDKGSLGLRQDTSGPVIVHALETMGVRVGAVSILPDDRARIAAQLRTWAEDDCFDLVITTGGTGAAPRDWTPEATRDVIDREMPGLAELLRYEGAKKTPLAALSRGIAGLRRHCLIINLPGSPKAVREGMETLQPVLPHALQMARGEDTEH